MTRKKKNPAASPAPKTIQATAALQAETGISESHIRTICLMILSAIMLAATLYWLQSVIVPLVLALFISLLLTPLVNYQINRLHFPRLLAIVMTMLLTFILFMGFAQFLIRSVNEFAANVGVYQTQLERLIDTAIAKLPLEEWGIDVERDFDLTSLIPVGATRTAIMSVTSSLIGMLSQSLLVMMFTIFLLLGGTTPRENESPVFREIQQQVRRYVGAKVLLSGVTGFLVFLIFHFLHIDYAMSFGAFAFFFNFIPNIGSVIATLLPLPIVFLSPEISLMTMTLALVLPGGVQFLIGNVVEPKIMGSSMDLHPVVVLLALMFWGAIWGIVGMLLAVPITSVIKICLSRLTITQPVARLLAGKL